MKTAKIIERKKQIAKILKNKDLLKKITIAHKFMWTKEGAGQLKLYLDHLPDILKYNWEKLSECVQLAQECNRSIAVTYIYSIERIVKSIDHKFIPFAIIDNDRRSYFFEITKDGELANTDVAILKMEDANE